MPFATMLIVPGSFGQRLCIARALIRKPEILFLDGRFSIQLITMLVSDDS